jgi:hypothetical protein
MALKKIFLLSAFLGVFLLLAALPVEAGRPRQAKNKPNSQISALTASMGIRAWVRFRPDRRAVLVNFSGFNKLKSVSYDFFYKSNGVSQGAEGTVALDDADTKTLLFGTCSSGVCTYHTNITDAYLKITSILKDNRKVIKTYRLKV